MLNQVLQVLVGLVLLFVIYTISLWVMQTDKVYMDAKVVSKEKIAIPILNGFVENGAFGNTMMNTQSEYSDNYVPLPKSLNRMGGIQFSYTFWINLPSMDTSDEMFENKILFFRGDRSSYTFKTKDGKMVTDYAIVCPLVRFGETRKDIIVEFNTFDNIRESIAIPPESVLVENGRWTMITIVLQDNIPINDFENGIKVQCFVDNLVAVTQSYRTSLRMNDGNLYVLPSTSPFGGTNKIEKGKLGNLTYYNYALNYQEVSQIYNKGPPTRIHAMTKSLQAGLPQSQNLPDDPFFFR